jgi:large subunit ribosomal protein L25
MSVQLTIEGKAREGRGKGYARKLRANNMIPANLIGAAKSTPIELDPKWLSKAWKQNDRKFDLVLNGETKTVVIKELQVHPVKRNALHVDLMYV